MSQPPGEPRDVAARDTSPRPLEAWWALLERDRDALFARVRSAHPMSRLEATIPHPFFGALNWATVWFSQRRLQSPEAVDDIAHTLAAFALRGILKDPHHESARQTAVFRHDLG